MRYHIFKFSSSSILLIADSQACHLDFRNFKILSLPGAKFHHKPPFIPPTRKYELIALFIGGNDLCDGFVPTNKTPEKVPSGILTVADSLYSVCNSVLVLLFGQHFPAKGFVEVYSMTNSIVTLWSTICGVRGLENNVGPTELSRSAYTAEANFPK